MANHLSMDKSFAIINLRDAGYSERRIAETLGVSRGAVRRHLRRQVANSTTARTDLGTGPLDSNGNKPLIHSPLQAVGSRLRWLPDSALAGRD